MRDGAAARPNGVNIDHRGHHRIAADPGIPRRGLGELAIDNQADIGGGAANIKGDQTFARGPFAAHGTAQHTRCRARQQCQDGPFRDHGAGGDAAVGAHDMQVRREAIVGQGAFQLLHIDAHLGPDEGIHGGGGEAFELPKLR